jgi:hypothetical protein
MADRCPFLATRLRWKDLVCESNISRSPVTWVAVRPKTCAVWVLVMLRGLRLARRRRWSLLCWWYACKWIRVWMIYRSGVKDFAAYRRGSVALDSLDALASISTRCGGGLRGRYKTNCSWDHHGLNRHIGGAFWGPAISCARRPSSDSRGASVGDSGSGITLVLRSGASVRDSAAREGRGGSGSLGDSEVIFLETKQSGTNEEQIGV